MTRIWTNHDALLFDSTKCQPITVIHMQNTFGNVTKRKYSQNKVSTIDIPLSEIISGFVMQGTNVVRVQAFNISHPYSWLSCPETSEPIHVGSFLKFWDVSSPILSPGLHKYIHHGSDQNHQCSHTSIFSGIRRVSTRIFSSAIPSSALLKYVAS